ncbi:MAG: Fur family transcriptional regulator [Candidatus Caldarchaeales archaeon]
MRREEIIEKLKKSRIKVTPQRLAICEIVFSSREHPTAYQVYEKVKKIHPSISPATVYSTLHLLSKIGLIQEMGFSNGISRFDSNISPHINLVCLNCGRIEDYRSKDFENLWAEIIREIGSRPIGQRIDLYIKCNKCTNTVP